VCAALLDLAVLPGRAGRCRKVPDRSFHEHAEFRRGTLEALAARAAENMEPRTIVQDQVELVVGLGPLAGARAGYELDRMDSVKVRVVRERLAPVEPLRCFVTPPARLGPSLGPGPCFEYDPVRGPVIAPLATVSRACCVRPAAPVPRLLDLVPVFHPYTITEIAMRFAGLRRTITTRLGPLLTTLVVLSVSGCEGDDPTAVAGTSTELLGTWDLSSFAFTSISTPIAKPDYVELGWPGLGYSGNIVFRGDRTYTFTTVYPKVGLPVPNLVEDGIFDLSGSTLSLTLPNEEPTLLLIEELTSVSATLFQRGTSYDFNRDGTETIATARIVISRQEG